MMQRRTGKRFLSVLLTSGLLFGMLPAAAWASENNIVNGYGNGAFGPEDPVAREQMAAILYRYAQFKIYDIAATGNLAGFSDAGDVSVYAVNPVKWAVGNGLISGMENGTLAPGKNATRRRLLRF